jgi:alkylation response protein AidB-like acyl-CoA dehydrogenase
MDFSATTLSPAEEALRHEVRDFLAAELPADHRPGLGMAARHDPEFSRKLAARGWVGMAIPPEYGGQGGTAVDRFLVTEELLAAGAPIAAHFVADRQTGPTLLHYGTEEQRRFFLPKIAAGECWFSLGMSEPDSGSDLASLRTRAVADGDTFVVNGQKVWTSFAALADWCYLICRTDVGDKPHQGISELIVDMKTPGIEVRPITDMTGNRHFCEVLFDDVVVPASNLVGERGGSWKQTMSQLEHERGGIDRLLSNRALYRDTLPRADTSDPLVRQEVADLESFYRIGRLLVLREVLGQAPKGFSAAAKAACTSFEQRVADFCARVSGPDAMLWNRVSRGVCYGPAYTIMGGTNNVLKNIVGERILGLPR